jgi:hypothetical protein
LGERLNGIQEVVSSILISSTNKIKAFSALWAVQSFLVPTPGSKTSAEWSSESTRLLLSR